MYGFDIWDAIDGRVPIRRAYALLGRLADDSRSIWRAKQLGGPELKDYGRWLNWDANTFILADIFDAIQINTNTFVGANTQDHKMPEFKPYPRPMDKTVEKPKSSLDDFANTLIKLGLA